MKYLAPLVIVCTTLALTGCTDHAANASQYIHSYIGNPGNADALRVDGRWVLYGLMSGASAEGPILGTILRKRISLVGTTLRSRSLAYKAALDAADARWQSQPSRPDQPPCESCEPFAP